MMNHRHSGRLLFVMSIMLLVSVYANSQHYTGTKNADTTSILHAFRTGTIEGHFRYFFMGTVNEGNLTDYYANAIGGGLKYETGKYKGFQLGVGGFFIYNIGSSDLKNPDESSGQLNRYEIGLFDITNPGNKHDIDRLEELYVKYNWKKSSVTVGAQIINTPFINEQDGRMRSTGVAGVYTRFNEWKNTAIEGGFISTITPRSTVAWYGAGKSIGVYPQGVSVLGIKSDYGGNTSSAGILLADVKHKPAKNITLQLSELFVENVFNTMLLQADWNHKLAGKWNSYASGQMIGQASVHNGGNDDPAKSYFGHGNSSLSFGMRAGVKNDNWNASLNLNRITAKGRYLMPREWGRDPFFTFLPRERNEGFGDVTALVFKTSYQTPGKRLKAEMGIGKFDLPDIKNYSLNKYGMPSYYHWIADLKYQFGGILKGADIHMLYAHKWLQGDYPPQEKFIINKVNMGNLNIVVNYQF